MADKKEVLRKYRDVFRGRKASGATTELYTNFYRDFEEAGLIDTKYSDHMNGKTLEDVMPDVAKMSYADCLTWLTFILRAQRWSDGWFADSTENGTIYRLLSRACELS